MKVRLPFRHNTIIYATPCNSDGTVTLRAEGGFGGIGGPSPGDGGGLEACDVEASSSAFVTSNIPIWENFDPAENEYIEMKLWLPNFINFVSQKLQSNDREMDSVFLLDVSTVLGKYSKFSKPSGLRNWLNIEAILEPLNLSWKFQRKDWGPPNFFYLSKF